MPTQVQIRRAASGTQNARTLAAGEPDFDLTNKRFVMHDGSAVGGIKHANAKDVQNNSFTYVAAAGTNTITATFAPAPAARAKGQRWLIQAANTVTGASTFNPNGLGAGTIYKKNASTSTIIAIAANDIIQNGFYALVDIDGSTGFELEAVFGGGLTTIKQGDLSTLTGSVSAAAPGMSAGSSTQIGDIGTEVTLPGGQYGFFPQLNTNTAPASIQGWLLQESSSTYTASLRTFTVKTTNTIGVTGVTHGALQRYVTTSPPFDIGDGEMMGFSYLLMNSDGTVDASYMADVPPWAYNGPTDIRPTRVCPKTGQKYIQRKKLPALDDYMAGAEIVSEETPLTMAIKNADMKLIPQPFKNYGTGKTIVMLDPMDERVRRLMEYQNAGGDISEILKRIKPDNVSLKRKQIKGVRQVAFKL